MDAVIAKLVLLIANILLGHLSGVRSSKVCSTPQYLQQGKTGTIKCAFPETFYGIYWYNSTDSVNEYPLISIQGSRKSGRGYQTGRFDILDDGSLIIKNVTILHEHFYRAIILSSSEDEPISYDIFAYIVVRSKQPYPYIDVCPNKPFCFIPFQNGLELNCGVKGTRPPVNLTWFIRKERGELTVSSKRIVSSYNSLFSTSLRMKMNFTVTNSIEALVCKVISPPNMTTISESTAFLEYTKKTFLNGKTVKKQVKNGTTLSLSCHKNETIRFIIWKRGFKSNEWDTIAKAYFGEKMFTEISHSDYTLDNTGSLVLSDVTIENEGSYMCLYSSGAAENVLMYDVLVHDETIPTGRRAWTFMVMIGAFILVAAAAVIVVVVRKKGHAKSKKPKDNEASQNYGKAPPTRNMPSSEVKKGHVKSEKPEDNKTSQKQELKPLLVQKSASVKDNDDDQNTSLNSNTSSTEVIPEPVKSEKAAQNDIPQRRELEEPPSETTMGIEVDEKMENDSEKEDRENAPLLEDTGPKSYLTLEEKKTLLEEHLKLHYRNLYEMFPVLGSSNEKCCVNDFFTDQELIVSYLELPSTPSTDTRPSKLKSHGDIFKRSQIKASRYIVIGDQGSGKSTIAVQMAYEWCEKRGEAYKEEYETFILLQLGKIRGVSTLHEAIKSTLPSSVQLTEEDIKEVIESYSKGLIVMNGFHTYKTQMESDLKEIMKGNHLDNFEVVIVTTPECIPDFMNFDVPRIQMAGFNEETQHAFVRKNCSDCKDSTYVNIMKAFEENPVLYKICQIPLFLAQYVNLCRVENGTVKSVTKFIMSVSSALEGHVKNNQEEMASQRVKEKLKAHAYKNILNGDCSGENGWWHINKIASEAVEIEWCRKTSFLSWDDNQGSKFGFRHKIFHEWYAAQHCASLTEDDLKKSIKKLFLNSSPFLKYFIFGLQKTSEPVISALHGLPPKLREVPILCLLELQMTRPKSNTTRKAFKDFFQRDILFTKDDSILHQSNTFRCLEIVSDSREVIINLHIEDCLEIPECSNEVLSLKSGVKIPRLPFMEKLSITQTGETVDGSKVIPILEYAVECSNLKIIKFTSCWLAERYEKGPPLERLKEANVKVEWTCREVGISSAILNYDSGRWQEKTGNVEINHKNYMEKWGKYSKKISLKNRALPEEQ